MMNWIAIQEKYKSQSLQAKRDLNITNLPPFFGCPTVMSFYKLKSCLLHFIGQLIQVQDASRFKKRKEKKKQLVTYNMDCGSSRSTHSHVQCERGPCETRVTWWKDLSPGFNSSIQKGTLWSLGDGSETRRIHQRLSGYFLNIGTRTETLLKVKPNLV